MRDYVARNQGRDDGVLEVDSSSGRGPVRATSRAEVLAGGRSRLLRIRKYDYSLNSYLLKSYLRWKYFKSSYSFICFRWSQIKLKIFQHILAC